MLCQTCDTRNDDTARFCHGCGSALPTDAQQPLLTGPVCPACGGQNPANARFCVFCATGLRDATVAAAPAPLYAPPPMRNAYPTPLAYAAPAAPGVNVMTNVSYAAPSIARINTSSATSLLVRAIWFFFIGWWLGGLWTIAAWLFNLTLIGMPVGLMMLNAMPTITTLQPRSRRRPLEVAPSNVAQHPLPLRAIWFVLVGWWASLVWSLLAFGLSLTFLLMPISFWMWNRVPTITTLAMEP